MASETRESTRKGGDSQKRTSSNTKRGGVREGRNIIRHRCMALEKKPCHLPGDLGGSSLEKEAQNPTSARTQLNTITVFLVTWCRRKKTVGSPGLTRGGEELSQKKEKLPKHWDTGNKENTGLRLCRSTGTVQGTG